MKRFEVGMKLYETADVKGAYITKSGKEVNHHFDKLRFVTDATVVKELTPLMSELVPSDVELLVGYSYGGVILASAVGTNIERNFTIMRKSSGDYVLEGSLREGKKVCLITDVIASAENVMELVHSVREKGASIDTVICAVRKNSEAAEQLNSQGINLKHVFTMNYLKQLMNE